MSGGGVGSAIGFRAGDSGGAPSRGSPVTLVMREVDKCLCGGGIPSLVRALRLARERMAELPDVAALVATMGVPRRTLEVRFRTRSAARQLAN